MTRNNVKRVPIVLTAALLAAVASGPVGTSGRESSLPASPQQSVERPTHRVRITAERFSFTPSRIKVKKGAIVEIVAESEDTSHGFHLPAAGIESMIPARGKGELRLRFEATQPGTYYFECTRPCGAGHNTMRGVIIVED